MPASTLRRPRRKEPDKLDAAVAVALAALLAYRPDFSAYQGDIEAELERVYLAAYAHAAPDATLTATVRGRATTFAQERAATLADDLAQTTADGIDSLATQARRGGMSLGDLGDALAGSFVFGAGRASKIAVTEIAIASALGHRQAAEDSGQDEKSSESAGDESVCSDCSDNEDAGWIGIDEPYPSGDDDTPFHPSCRCSSSFRSATDTGAEQDAATVAVVKEAVCGTCGRWLGRNVNADATLHCEKCGETRLTPAPLRA